MHYYLLQIEAQMPHTQKPVPHEAHGYSLQYCLRYNILSVHFPGLSPLKSLHATTYQDVQLAKLWCSFGLTPFYQDFWNTLITR